MTAPGSSLLIIGPDPETWDSVRDALHADGHTATLAADVDAALPLLETETFDLILLASPEDPAVERWAASERLHAASETVPVVLLSAEGASPFAGYRGHGLVGLIVTPCDPDDLSTALRPLLRQTEVA